MVRVGGDVKKWVGIVGCVLPRLTIVFRQETSTASNS
ncbi:unnamed protein product [Sphacelaria rigidula]